MALLANSAKIDVEEVIFNGVDCDKVYMNGALVFEKVSDGVLFSGTITVGSVDIPGEAPHLWVYIGFV